MGLFGGFLSFVVVILSGALLFGNFLISVFIFPRKQDSEDSWFEHVSDISQALFPVVMGSMCGRRFV